MKVANLYVVYFGIEQTEQFTNNRMYCVLGCPKIFTNNRMYCVLGCPHIFTNNRMYRVLGCPNIFTNSSGIWQGGEGPVG